MIPENVRNFSLKVLDTFDRFIKILLSVSVLGFTMNLSPLKSFFFFNPTIARYARYSLW